MIHPVIRKIKEFLIQNKHITLLIVGVFVLFLMFFSFLPKNRYSGVALIENPLFFYKNFTVEIPKSVSEKVEINKKGVEILKIENENLNIKIESILSQLQVSLPNKTNTASIFYEWKNKQGDLAQYDAKTQKLNIVLVDKKNIFPNIALPSDTQLASLLSEFVFKYINSDFKYFDTNLIKENGNYKIEGRRMINNLPLSYPGMSKYHDIIILDSNLNLISAEISLLEIEKEPLDRIKLVKPISLDRVISTEKYPKSVNQGLPQGLKEKKDGKVKSESDNLDVGIAKVTKAVAQTLSVVYYFSNINQQFLIPVYRIEGSGKIIYKGQEYSVPVIVNANALDPDKVYIPSNISFAD